MPLLFSESIGYSQITKSESIYAGVYSMMAGIESIRTDFDDGLENIKIAYSLCKNESNITVKVTVIVMYSFILYGRGDVEGIKKMLNEADDILKQNIVFPNIMWLYVAMKGFSLIKQNELEKANHFFKENGLEFDKKITYSDDLGYYPYAYLLISERKFEEAEILLSKLLKLALTANRVERIIETKVIYANLNMATGDKEKALTNLIEALEAAACENILMSFVLYHSGISDLLKEVYKYRLLQKPIFLKS